jgi:two-component system LytT family response regulator
MIRTLIVDDEAPARAKLQRWLAEQDDIDVIAAAADGLAAADIIATADPQVVFLDIQMPGMSGLEVAAQLEPEAAPLLVFVTAHDEHAIKAFELNAIDYLLKPYDKERLLRTLGRIRLRLMSPQSVGNAVRTARSQVGPSERLLVPEGDRLRPIECEHIQWLQADDNYVHVHTQDRDFLLRRTLQDLLEQLGAQRFVRIHKSTAINLAEVHSLEPLFKGDYDVVLRSGQRLRMSRRYKDLLFGRMGR